MEVNFIMFYSLIYFSLCLGSRMLRKNSITEVSEKRREYGKDSEYMFAYREL